MYKQHQTVLLNETISNLALKKGDTVIDCTGGGGGHSELLGQTVGKEGRVYTFDQDPESIQHLYNRFKDQGDSHIVLQRRFSEILKFCQEQKLVGKINGIVADIGMSSHHIDQSTRGFSFLNEGPLDMRMNPKSDGLKAKDVIDHFSQQELEAIFREYGEEKFAKRIASSIVEKRQEKVIATTLELAQIIKDSYPKRHYYKTHPATKVFQALRIFLNSEIEELKILLQDSLEILQNHGRIAIISFHSLEDRTVKTFFKTQSQGILESWERSLPVSNIGVIQKPTGTLVKPYPIKPSDEEIQKNPRARSAILRIFERRRENL